MKFHGIDAQGTLYDQRVSALPTWSNADLGRIVFLTTNDTVYIASSTGWVPLSSVDALTAGAGISITKVSTPAQSITITLADSLLSSGRKMWIYEDTAPTGWSIVSGCGDGLLAVKGGSSSYNITGGTTVGTWTQSSHNHTVTIDTEASHTHSIAGTHNHSIPAVALSVAQMPQHRHELSPCGGQITQDEMYGGNYGTGPKTGSWNYAWYTDYQGSSATHDHNGTTGLANTGSSSAGTSHTHTNTVSTVAPSSAWRPLANVGIIIEKD